MALSCLGNPGNEESLELVDSSFLTMPNTGWSIFGMIYPDTGISSGSFAYIYSHAQPLNVNPAVNILKSSPGGTIRTIVDNAGNLVDFDTSNAVIGDQWNGLAVVYDGVNLRTTLNGITTQVSPPALSTVNPAGNARIGHAIHGGAREWNGRIAELAKWDRVLTIAEVEAYTDPDNLFSPLLAQTDQQWHLEMFNAGFAFDMQNNVAVVDGPTAPLFGRHASASYPSADQLQLSTVTTAPGMLFSSPMWTMA